MLMTVLIIYIRIYEYICIYIVVVFLTLTHRYNAVRGHRTGSNNSGAKDYLRRKYILLVISLRIMHSTEQLCVLYTRSQWLCITTHENVKHGVFRRCDKSYWWCSFYYNNIDIKPPGTYFYSLRCPTRRLTRIYTISCCRCRYPIF